MKKLIMALFLFSSAISYSQKYSLSFDGTDDYVRLTTAISSALTPPMTIEAWVYANDLSNRQGIFSTRLNNAAGSFQLEVGPGDGEGTNRVMIYGVGTLVAASEDNKISTGTWTHIAYTRAADGTQYLYINGIRQTLSSSAGYTFQTNSSYSVLGSGTNGGQFFNGKIDEVRIWSVVRTASQISDNKNSELTGSETGLLAYYKMTDGSGTSLTDNSGNSHTGTLVNGVTWSDNGPVYIKPTVTTQAVTSNVAVTALGHGTITDLGYPNPTAHGVCWSTSGSPTISNNKSNNGSISSAESFVATVSGLKANTKYYVRAYATNSGGTSYGSTVSFTTEAESFAGGSGTESNPYQVATPAQLDFIRNHTSSYFIQTADIDMNIVPYNTASGWQPIGEDGDNRFEGYYNGSFNKISNLYIKRGGTDNVGLFGYITYGCWIKNVILENVDITGGGYTGGLCGNPLGDIYNSSVSGSVNGTSSCGGLAGMVHSGLNNSYSSANVSGTSNVGGLAGVVNDCSIYNAYATGSVNGNSYVAGLIGEIEEGFANRTFSTGAVTGDSHVGGLVGETQTSSVYDSYWDKETSGQTTSYGGTGKTTAQMKTQSTFTNWNFDAASGVWAIDASGVINNGYPYLTWQIAPAIQAKSIAFSGTGSEQTTISWTKGDATRRAVFMKKASSGSATPVMGTTYTASTTFGSGTQIGSTGWYCVYNGIGSSVTVTGLTLSTDYTVQVFEYNGSNGAERYLTTTATNNPNTNTTALPVELTSFITAIENNIVTLNWQTATEVNNYGFEIERCEKQEARSETWKKIGFVQGHGNSNSVKEYSFSDDISQLLSLYLNPNLTLPKDLTLSYRLKQIDNNGIFSYSNEIIVETQLTTSLPTEYVLYQNYPNPFNPTTCIKYQIANVSQVSLIVYDLLGNKIDVLVNEQKSPGNYESIFDGSKLVSGMYIYQLNAGSFTQTKKLLLIK